MLPVIIIAEMSVSRWFLLTHVEGASEVKSPLDRQLGTPFIRRVHVES